MSGLNSTGYNDRKRLFLEKGNKIQINQMFFRRPDLIFDGLREPYMVFVLIYLICYCE